MTQFVARTLPLSERADNGRGASPGVPATNFPEMYSRAFQTERRVRDLTDAIDDLTTFAQSPEVMPFLIASRPELAAVMLKLNDLLIETMQRSNA